MSKLERDKLQHEIDDTTAAIVKTIEGSMGKPAKMPTRQLFGIGSALFLRGIAIMVESRYLQATGESAPAEIIGSIETETTSFALDTIQKGLNQEKRKGAGSVQRPWQAGP